MKCIECGSENAAGARFCGFCGARMAAAPVQSIPEDAEPTRDAYGEEARPSARRTGEDNRASRRSAPISFQEDDSALAPRRHTLSAQEQALFFSDDNEQEMMEEPPVAKKPASRRFGLDRLTRRGTRPQEEVEAPATEDFEPEPAQEEDPLRSARRAALHQVEEAAEKVEEAVQGAKSRRFGLDRLTRRGHSQKQDPLEDSYDTQITDDPLQAARQAARHQLAEVEEEVSVQRERRPLRGRSAAEEEDDQDGFDRATDPLQAARHAAFARQLEQTRQRAQQEEAEIGEEPVSRSRRSPLARNRVEEEVTPDEEPVSRNRRSPLARNRVEEEAAPDEEPVSRTRRSPLTRNRAEEEVTPDEEPVSRSRRSPLTRNRVEEEVTPDEEPVSRNRRSPLARNRAEEDAYEAEEPSEGRRVAFTARNRATQEEDTREAEEAPRVRRNTRANVSPYARPAEEEDPYEAEEAPRARRNTRANVSPYARPVEEEEDRYEAEEAPRARRNVRQAEEEEEAAPVRSSGRTAQRGASSHVRATSESGEAMAERLAASRPTARNTPQRMFLFDEEEEEEARRREERAALLREWEDEQSKAKNQDGVDELEEEEEEEATSRSSGNLFIRLFTIVTILVLIIGLVAFLFGTSVGHRLRASAGLSSSPQDYLLLGDWQKEQGNPEDAAVSYYNAYKLNSDDYDLALKVGDGFESVEDDNHAEQLYVAMIEKYPEQSEPYERLMALLTRQERYEQYNALLLYREQHQTDYVAPAPVIPSPPKASIDPGSHADTIHLELTAEAGTIYYTLDNTPVSKESTEYTGPIVLSTGDSYTVRAIAIAKGYSSPEWSGVYNVGLAVPDEVFPLQGSDVMTGEAQPATTDDATTDGTTADGVIWDGGETMGGDNSQPGADTPSEETVGTPA